MDNGTTQDNFLKRNLITTRNYSPYYGHKFLTKIEAMSLDGGCMEPEQTFSELLVAWFPIKCSSRDSSTLASWMEKMMLGYTAQSAVGNLPT